MNEYIINKKAEMVGISKDEKGLINSVLDIAKKIKEIDALIIVGSIVKGLYKSGRSGIDLLLLIGDEFVEAEVLKKLLMNGLFFENSDDIYILNNTCLSIHIQKYNSYIEYLYSIITLHDTDIVMKEWTIGGVCKDVILDDISKAIVLYDKKKKFTEVVGNLGGKYIINDKFGGKLIYQLIKKMELTINEFTQKNYILFQIGFFECIEILERIYCHEKAIYNPGFKHILNEREFIDAYGLCKLDSDQVRFTRMLEILINIKKIYGDQL